MVKRCVAKSIVNKNPSMREYTRHQRPHHRVQPTNHCSHHYDEGSQGWNGLHNEQHEHHDLHVIQVGNNNLKQGRGHRTHIAPFHEREVQSGHYSLARSHIPTEGEEIQRGLEETGRLEDGRKVPPRSLQHGKCNDNHETAHSEADRELGWTEEKLSLTCSRKITVGMPII